MLADGVNCYNVALITVKKGALVSQRAHLCAATHDTRDDAFTLKPRPITVGQQCWVAAEAFVGPGVAIGEGAVLGARAVAFHDLDAWSIYRGNPAQFYKPRPRVGMMHAAVGAVSEAQP